MRKKIDTSGMAKHRKIHTHPGEILKEELLKPLEISANHLATSLGVPANQVSAIINGERAITADTAILLGKAFNTTPEFWINLQGHYDLDLARAQASSERIRRAGKFAKDHGLT
jgi:addiction module HigA family antidote